MGRDSLGTYLDEIGRYPLLTASQEIELSRQIRRMIDLQEQGKKRYTKTEQRAIRIGQKAKEKLIRHNLRLVVYVARKFCSRMSFECLEMTDLIQEGSIGLARACDMFDGTKGYKFSTYAYWWIKQSMRRGIDNTSRMIRLPVHASDKMYAIRKFTEAYRMQHCKSPSLAEIAEHIEMSEDWVKLLMERCLATTSLDQVYGHSGELHMSDFIADPATSDQEAAYDEIEMDSLSRNLWTGLSMLPEREREIFIMRYGLDNNYQISSLDKIGKRYGVCRERSRQLLKRATNNLRIKTRQLANHSATVEPAEHRAAA